MEKHFTELSLSYEKVKNVKFQTDVRFIENWKGDREYKKEYRLAISATIYKQINRLEGLYRLQYQNDDEDFMNFSNNENSQNAIKNKFELRYDLNNVKLEPYINGELFHQNKYGEKYNFSKYRLSTGFRYKINKLNSVKLFLMMEQEISNFLPYRFLIIGINYKYSI